MTQAEFRRLALSFPETEEKQHMDHPDFRVRGKIFATLAYPDKAWAMVKLNPLDQARFFEAEPEVFIPLKGTWGRRGATQVCLKAAGKESVRRALAAAWRNTAPKRLAAQIDSLD
ncbi:MAG TPA: MmcQ/YjbR family DNA-binding protein [Terriglobales bacterium]|jgi:hypothetical protein|nr:MmcQ/YjbR family DNA-binding protein [Terriglobales bacterium]